MLPAVGCAQRQEREEAHKAETRPGFAANTLAVCVLAAKLAVAAP